MIGRYSPDNFPIAGPGMFNNGNHEIGVDAEKTRIDNDRSRGLPVEYVEIIIRPI